MAESRPARVERNPASTTVIYGVEPGRAYLLRPNDVQLVEERIGKTLEIISEAELRSTLEALGIPVQPPDPAAPPRPAALPPGEPGPVTVVPSVAKPAPPPPAPPRRNPWAILLPIISGGVVLLLLVFLLRSCGARSTSPAVTETPSPTATALTATPGGATVTARVDAPLRAGPGDPYPVVGVLVEGQSVEAVGISPDRRWYAVRFLAAPDGQGWVHVDQVDAENIEGLPVIQPPPLPTGTPTPSPTATVTASVTPSPTPIQAPVAVISGPTTGEAGQRLRYDARRSTAAPGSGLTAFDWDFGDGVLSSGIEVEHVYNRPGIYNLLLRVTDSNGLRGEALQRVEIRPAPATATPLPPRAVISAPPSAEVNQPVAFDGRESTAPAPIVQYRWTFGDGGMEEGARVSHTYFTPGVFNVTLVIIDEAGRESIAATQIEVRGAQPTPTAVPSLVGATWALTAYGNGAGGLVAALPGVTVTASFNQGGNLTGSGGCNSYTSTYQATGGAITIQPPAATGALCAEPPGVMEQEQAYFALLPQAANYRLSGDRLELIGGGGAILLQFARLAQPL